jgi:transcriptional regulator with XRE-family HTH domain
MAVKKNAIKAMEASLTEEDIRLAHAKSEQMILAIKLAELREERGIKQNELTRFSQTAVSKLERRKDMKVSTLIDYLDGLGLGLELRVYPKNKKSTGKAKTLLKV